MVKNTTQRRLTAILSADVKGYSKLMGDDDESTVNTITAYREIISKLIQAHEGRVVDTPGDNVLAQFGSALNAVNSAIDIQRTLEIENKKLTENRRMDFRIGINLGDILHKDDRIYGDGVNVAARIENLADPGGICISRGVFDQVKNKIRKGFEYLGEHTVKNISEPVRIYRLLLTPEDEGRVVEEIYSRPTKSKKRYSVSVVIILICIAAGFWIFFQKTHEIEPASEKAMEYPLPEKPSIAVLPFDNMTGDPEQKYFSDGLTEEIIAALSSVPKLFVIARNSTFTYKGKFVKVQQVSEELGVRYVIEGSVRKSGDEIRITAQLVDAINGHHLWAERYDRNLSDIFAVQDEITKKIILALQVKLTDGEEVRVAAKGTNNLQAYLKYLQANELFYKHTPEDCALARKLAEEAVALDPGYASAYYVQSKTHILDMWFGTSKSPKASMAKAKQLLQKAIVLNDTFADAHAFLGWLFAMTKQYDKALSHGEKAVAFNPNSAESHMRYGKILTQVGKYQESISELQKAIRINPIPPNVYLYSLGLSYCFNGQYDQAIKWCERAVREDPNALFARLFLALIYSFSGRDEEARIEAAEVLKIYPMFSLENFAKRCAHKDKMQCERVASALRKAGLK